MSILLVFIFLAIAAQRLLELRLAEKNRALAMAQGAKEFGAEHYFLFVVLHVSWMLGWLTEGWLNARNPELWADGDVGMLIMTVASIMIFLAAQGLRYWAIWSLDTSWNTRILVVPGAKRVRRGAYKYLTHPNYVAVALELASVPLIFGAWKTALAASLANAVILLFMRIPAENRALQEFLKDNQ
jgi:methyltransferase